MARETITIWLGISASTKVLYLPRFFLVASNVPALTIQQSNSRISIRRLNGLRPILRVTRRIPQIHHTSTLNTHKRLCPIIPV